jgi:superfamily II DNA or RNA helicase
MNYQIVINNVYSQILPALDEKVLKALRNKLSYEVVGAYYARKISPYAGVRYFFSPKLQQFPTGMIHYVREVLDLHKVSYDYVDKRLQPVLGQEIPFHGSLRDYQEEAVKRALESQRGVVKASTGSGKSHIIANLIAKLNIPTILFIHKKDVFYQLVSTLEKTLQIPVGQIGDGQCTIERINVAMIQTVARAFDPTLKAEENDNQLLKEKGDIIRKLVQDVQCLITDEVHHLASDSFWTVYKNANNAFYRYGFSASPWRDDHADIMIEGGTAKQIIDIPASSLIDRNYLSPVDIYLYDFEHERQPRGIRYAALYDQEIMNNTKRNQLIVDLALKAVDVGKSVLIAVTKIEHGEILEELLQKQDPTAIFVHGESNTDLRRKILDGLSNHTQRIAICTTIFGEGVDAPGLDVLINAKAGASSVDAFQLVGRVLRIAPGKKKAYVIDISDEGCRFFGPHSNERLKIYSTEKNYNLHFVKDIHEVRFDG